MGCGFVWYKDLRLGPRGGSSKGTLLVVRAHANIRIHFVVVWNWSWCWQCWWQWCSWKCCWSISAEILSTWEILTCTKLGKLLWRCQNKNNKIIWCYNSEKAPNATDILLGLFEFEAVKSNILYLFLFFERKNLICWLVSSQEITKSNIEQK